MSERNSNFMKKFFHIVVNKYTIVLLIFFVYLTLFDHHSLIKRKKQTLDIQKLEQEYLYYKTSIEESTKQIHLLKTDTAFLEKYAREKYFLKKNNEDVFILDKQ